jgi:hypothetical protein
MANDQFLSSPVCFALADGTEKACFFDTLDKASDFVL